MQNARVTTTLASSVLVLNRFYSAIHVVQVRRAFALLFRDTAEVIHIEDGQYVNYDFESWCAWSELSSCNGLCNGHADWVRAVSFSIQIPRVIRLLYFEKTPRQSLRFNRRNLFARDGNCCQYCGQALPSNQLSMDHVVPRSRGGQTNWENIVCSCLKCNTRKGGRTPNEARMQLIRPPVRPKHNPLLTVKLDNPKYEMWRTFLPKNQTLDV